MKWLRVAIIAGAAVASLALLIVWVVLVWWLIFHAGVARAAPPEGSDPHSPAAIWYRSLRVPGGPMREASCCSIADCRPVRSRMMGDHWEVWIDSATFPDVNNASFLGNAPNAWVTVPDRVILRGRENPMGEAIVCWHDREIRCFVAASAT